MPSIKKTEKKYIYFNQQIWLDSDQSIDNIIYTNIMCENKTEKQFVKKCIIEIYRKKSTKFCDEKSVGGTKEKMLKKIIMEKNHFRPK